MLIEAGYFVLTDQPIHSSCVAAGDILPNSNIQVGVEDMDLKFYPDILWEYCCESDYINYLCHLL